MSLRRVQPRHEDSDDDTESRNLRRRYNSDGDETSDQTESSHDGSNSSETDDTHDASSEESDEESRTFQDEDGEDDLEDTDTAIKDVSFGTLASAAASLPPQSRKRKVPSDFDPTHSHTPDSDKSTQGYGRRAPPPTRTSKHAPTILPSTTQVSRSRTIFSPPPNLKSRDPRFDATILSHSHPSTLTSTNKAYSFLNTYTASEILTLKQQIRSTQDPTRIASLKAEVMAYENRLRASASKQRERDVLQTHKKAEKEKIRTGQKTKPYYLKRGEVRKKVEEIRVEGMSGKAKEKMERNRAKRVKTRESRVMPRERRG